MFQILYGSPFLSLLFLSAFVWGLFSEHSKLKRHSVTEPFYWRVILFAAWLMLVPTSAMLCFASIDRQHGTTLVTEIKVLLVPLALLHNGILRPFFKKYEEAALNLL